MLFLATNIESLVFGDHVVRRTLEFVVSLGRNCVGQFLLKLILSLLDLVLDLLVLLLALLLILQLQLKHGLAHLETGHCLFLLVTQAGELLLLDYLLNAL